MDIINKITRSYIKRKYSLLKVLNIQQKNINPWAFVRAYNEIEMISVALETMLGGGITRGVIAYHYDENGKDDGTADYIKYFCKINKNFILAEYPYTPVLTYNEDHINTDIKSIDINKRLDSYYNFTLSHIPKNEWYLKIDVDHIYNPEALSLLTKQSLHKYEAIAIPRVNMHYIDGELYIFKNKPYYDGKDQLLLNNRKDIFYKFDLKNRTETLHLPLTNIKVFEHIGSIHFPCMKKSRNNVDIKELTPYDKFDFSKIKLTDIDKRFILNKNKIISYLNKQY